MAQVSNYEKYPKNIFRPREVVIDGEKYTYFLNMFQSIGDLHDYLTSNPRINIAAFDEKNLSSRNNTYGFAGEPYDKALNDLINDEDPQYLEFSKIINSGLTNADYVDGDSYRTVRTLAGGYLNPHLYCVGEPLCYETEELIKQPKFINIYSALSYSSGTSDGQIFNRSIILISIINALKKSGYTVDLNAFEMSYEDHEIVNNVVGLTKPRESIDLQSIYKTYKKEFLRRILFGVLETIEVKGPWSGSYGHTCKESFVRKLLQIEKDAIYFATAQELGIKGDDLMKDLQATLHKLKLEDIIDVREMDESFQEQVKKLRK